MIVVFVVMLRRLYMKMYDFSSIEFNEYQTLLTEELCASYPHEVIEQLWDYLGSVEYIRNLVSIKRRRACDMPRDELGRIIVDFENPHILEGMDYFRGPALHYMEYGNYTELRPNSNPHSEYRLFWDEEVRRIREGYVRESDGEWVTGFCYWFFNYNPMLVNRRESGRKAVRIESFPDFFEGIYLRFHYLERARAGGHHAIELARRGCGKSYSLSSIMTHNLELGESEVMKRRVVTVLTAYQKEYLSDSKDGTLSKFKPALNFIWANTPFPHLALRNAPVDMVWQMGYRDELGIERGSLNQVLAVSSKDDSEKLRGKRGWILFEEMGSFRGLLSLYDITRKSVEDGDLVFACMYLVGTAAEDESDFSSAKTLLYSPDAYNLLSIRNVYDKPQQGRDRFGYFFPAYLNRAGCYNKDGVTDVIKALLEVLMLRYRTKYGADPRSVLRIIAEDPITPAEAIIKVKTSYFPASMLNERILELDSTPGIYSDIYVGELVGSDDDLEFRPTNDEPIRHWNVNGSTLGALEIFEMPQKQSGSVVFGRYIVGHDPVDNDQSSSSSLSSTFVLDLFTDRIVAEYTGRQLFADDNFEIVRKLCLFYNTRVLFESNKKGIYAYFQRKGCTHLLAETPEYLREKQLVKYSNFGSNRYGVNATAAINDYANNLLRDWLLEGQVVSVIGEGGKEEQRERPMLYMLRNRALLEECANFNPIVNVDRIRAMGMVMLYREEKRIYYQGQMDKIGQTVLGDDGADDEYFRINFDDKYKKDRSKDLF